MRAIALLLLLALCALPARCDDLEQLQRDLTRKAEKLIDAWEEKRIVRCEAGCLRAPRAGCDCGGEPLDPRRLKKATWDFLPKAYQKGRDRGRWQAQLLELQRKTLQPSRLGISSELRLAAREALELFIQPRLLDPLEYEVRAVHVGRDRAVVLLTGEPSTQSSLRLLPWLRERGGLRLAAALVPGEQLREHEWFAETTSVVEYLRTCFAELPEPDEATLTEYLSERSRVADVGLIERVSDNRGSDVTTLNVVCGEARATLRVQTANWEVGQLIVFRATPRYAAGNLNEWRNHARTLDLRDVLTKPEQLSEVLLLER